MAAADRKYFGKFALQYNYRQMRTSVAYLISLVILAKYSLRYDKVMKSRDNYGLVIACTSGLSVGSQGYISAYKMKKDSFVSEKSLPENWPALAILFRFYTLINLQSY